MPTPTLTLSVVPGRFAVCRLGPGAEIPAWAFQGDFVSVTRTTEELSILCDEVAVPEGVTREAGWACLKVDGPLDFSLTGVMAALTAPLAAAGLSCLAVATYDTDYLLVKADALSDACAALRQAGFGVDV